MRNWDLYDEIAGDTPNSLVVHVVDQYVHERKGALDLGAGNLRDSKFLINSGFERVDAVDEDPRSSNHAQSGIDLYIKPVQEYVPEAGSFDLVICCNTLFLLSPQHMQLVFDAAFTGLKSGGVFTCNLLGERDDWVMEGKPTVSHVLLEDINRLQKGWRVLEFPQERQWCDATSKNWHTWSLILQKP